MHLACASGDDSLIKWLIKRGADVTVVDSSGATPGHLLAKWAAVRPDSIARLKKAGAYFTSQGVLDKNGDTPDAIAQRAVEEHTRKQLGYSEKRRKRRANDELDGYEGLGDVSRRRRDLEDTAWREKLLKSAEADAGGDTLFEETGTETCMEDAGEQTHQGSYASFFNSFAEDDGKSKFESFDARTYFEDEEKAYRSYNKANSSSGGMGKQSTSAFAQASATQKRDAEAQRVLDDLRREDTAWRARVTSGKSRSGKSARIETPAYRVFSLDTKTYRAAWGQLGAMADRGETLTFEDVPWPMGDGKEISADEVLRVLLGVDSSEHLKASHRGALRVEMLRWHPDKFEGRVGGLVADSDRERVRFRVNTVARVVAELFKRTSV